MKHLRRILFFACALALLPLSAGAQLNFHPRKPATNSFASSGGGCTPLTAATAGLDGSMYLTQDGGPSGFADSKAITLSVWVDRTGGDGTLDYLFWSESNKLLVYFNTSNQLEWYGDNGGVHLAGHSAVTKVASDGWTHILLTFDVNSANHHVYFNGTEDSSAAWTTFDNVLIDLDSAGFPARRICGGDGGADNLTASVAEFYLSNRYLNDVTKFYCTGHPVSLGSDGSTPDGQKPGFYFSLGGSGNSWNLDSANGNTFTRTGSFGSPASP